MSAPLVLPPPPSGLPRASDERRRRLKDGLSVPTVSNFFAIDRYYDAADKVYSGFQEAFQLKKLDDAYVYGSRYCWFCLDAIPTHNYYKADKYKGIRGKHAGQVKRVVQQLEQVAQWMDAEEEERQRLAALEAQRLAEERARQEAEKFQQLQARAQKLSMPSSSAKPPLSATTNLQQSALSKLELLRVPSEKQTEVGSRRVRQDPSGEEPMGVPSSRYRLDDDSEDEQRLPPAMEPPTTGGHGSDPPPPPSYDQIMATGRNGKYHQSSSSFLGPSAPHASALLGTQPEKHKRQPRLSMRQLQDQYRQQYSRCVQDGRITVMGLDTYQGRLSQSTNGCTVISALVAARHLSAAHGTVTDSDVNQVIDRQCGPLLREIRGKLGLGGAALIIPSDVHDHLVDKKILQQKYFEGAAGGNVMDPEHMGEFLKLLSVGDDGKGGHRKAAATFFFREHVISIVKGVPSYGQPFYDLIDSLPSLSSVRGSQASRTRCQDVEALTILMGYYTSRKFSDSNCSYIDKNSWDDAMADLDPRVFQGFVWSVK